MNKPIPISALQQQQAELTSERASARIWMGTMNVMTMRKHDIKQVDSQGRTVWTEDDFSRQNGIYAILAGMGRAAQTDDHVVDNGSDGSMTPSMRDKIEAIKDEVFQVRPAPTAIGGYEDQTVEEVAEALPSVIGDEPDMQTRMQARAKQLFGDKQQAAE